MVVSKVRSACGPYIDRVRFLAITALYLTHDPIHTRLSSSLARRTAIRDPPLLSIAAEASAYRLMTSYRQF